MSPLKISLLTVIGVLIFGAIFWDSQKTYEYKEVLGVATPVSFSPLPVTTRRYGNRHPGAFVLITQVKLDNGNLYQVAMPSWAVAEATKEHAEIRVPDCPTAKVVATIEYVEQVEKNVEFKFTEIIPCPRK